MYVSVTLRNPIISRATRKRSITCANVTLRNVTASLVPRLSLRHSGVQRSYVKIVRGEGEPGDEAMSLLCRPLKSAGRSPPCTTIVRDVGVAVRTQRSGGQPEYEPIRAACNRLAQLSTCTYLLQRHCDSGERRVRST